MTDRPCLTQFPSGPCAGTRNHRGDCTANADDIPSQQENCQVTFIMDRVRYPCVKVSGHPGLHKDAEGGTWQVTGLPVPERDMDNRQTTAIVDSHVKLHEISERLDRFGIELAGKAQNSRADSLVLRMERLEAKQPSPVDVRLGEACGRTVVDAGRLTLSCTRVSGHGGPCDDQYASSVESTIGQISDMARLVAATESILSLLKNPPQPALCGATRPDGSYSGHPCVMARDHGELHTDSDGDQFES